MVGEGVVEGAGCIGEVVGFAVVETHLPVVAELEVGEVEVAVEDHNQHQHGQRGEAEAEQSQQTVHSHIAGKVLLWESE